MQHNPVANPRKGRTGNATLRLATKRRMTRRVVPPADGQLFLTSFVLAAVLFGALIHATWNALIKAQADKFAASALVAVGAGVVALPVMAALPAPPPAAWPYIAASAVIHVGYFLLVAFAYRSADLGVAYPLTRGTAPPATALLAFLLLGETLGLNGWLAVTAVAIGIIALSADAISRNGLNAATTTGALTNAGVIVLYTLVDGVGARVTGSGFIYVAWMLAATAILLLALMLALRGAVFLKAVRGGWRLAIGGGTLALASYAIALWAMTVSPIGLVAALRETSVLFAAILGAILFKEPFGPRRWMALVLIVGGIVILRSAGS
jgi:drug/metabolite transporter (DMT)-like permease